MSLQIISHHQIKTRKSHPCWGCAKEFPAGSSLWVCVSKQDEISRTYWCDRCQEVVNHDPDWHDGYMFGDLAEVIDGAIASDTETATGGEE